MNAKFDVSDSAAELLNLLRCFLEVFRLLLEDLEVLFH